MKSTTTAASVHLLESRQGRQGVQLRRRRLPQTMGPAPQLVTELPPPLASTPKTANTTALGTTPGPMRPSVEHGMDELRIRVPDAGGRGGGRGGRVPWAFSPPTGHNGCC